VERPAHIDEFGRQAQRVLRDTARFLSPPRGFTRPPRRSGIPAEVEGRTVSGSKERRRERGGGRWHRSGPLEIAEYVAAQSVCGGRDVQEVLAQEAEVPRLHQLRAEASVDSILAPPNGYPRSVTVRSCRYRD